jgi:hypothetical protein
MASKENENMGITMSDEYQGVAFSEDQLCVNWPDKNIVQ